MSSLYDKACQKLYRWQHDENFLKSLGKSMITFPGTIACGIGAESWMGGYVKETIRSNVK